VDAVNVSRLLILTAALALPLAASAQRQKSVVPELDAEGHRGDMARAAQKKANERFNKADENKDDIITQEEALKHLPYVGENFDKFDANKNGKLTWEEYIGHDKWKREPTQ
jgi:hypothetical protein